MSNGFDFYEGTASENTTPRITVRKGGQLVLTSGAVDMLGDDEAYDGGIVGLRLVEEPADAETPAPAKKTGGRRKAKAAA